MEYQVPQFIEVEDKIFGPLTLKQFIYIAGGAGLVVVLVLYLPLVLGVILALPIAAFAAALAFYKVNGKPFLDIIEAGFNYYLNRRLYLWKKDTSVAGPEAMAPDTRVSLGAAPPPREKLNLTSSRLEELARSLDSKTTSTQ